MLEQIISFLMDSEDSEKKQKKKEEVEEEEEEKYVTCTACGKLVYICKFQALYTQVFILNVLLLKYSFAQRLKDEPKC
jgi:ferredoxin